MHFLGAETTRKLAFSGDEQYHLPNSVVMAIGDMLTGLLTFAMDIYQLGRLMHGSGRRGLIRAHGTQSVLEATNMIWAPLSIHLLVVEPVSTDSYNDGQTVIVILPQTAEDQTVLDQSTEHDVFNAGSKKDLIFKNMFGTIRLDTLIRFPEAKRLTLYQGMKHFVVADCHSSVLLRGSRVASRWSKDCQEARQPSTTLTRHTVNQEDEVKERHRMPADGMEAPH